MGKDIHGEFVSLYGVLTDTAIEELQRLQREFPAETRRALAGLGFVLRNRVQAAMRAGGPKGQRWQRLSVAQQTQRIEKVKRGKELKLRRLKKRERYDKRQSIPNAFTRLGSYRRTERSMGKMIRGIRYRMSADKSGVLVGGLNYTMERALKAVQTGTGFRGEFGRSETITPKMRQLFFLAGIPLRKSGTIRHPERPLIRPVFERYSRAIFRFIELRVRNFVERRGENRDRTARQAGFYDWV